MFALEAHPDQSLQKLEPVFACGVKVFESIFFVDVIV
jgi:hypothetical protein